MITTLVIVFLLNVLSNTLGTLKTIFISKRVTKPAYIVTFIDSIVFTYGFKMVASDDSLWLIIAFASGKVVGAILADYIDSKMAFGLLELTIYSGKEKATEIADSLRGLGFSVTTVKGYGINGSERFEVNIAMERKGFPLVREFLKKHGYSNATMVVRDINSYSGKFLQTGKVSLNKS